MFFGVEQDVARRSSEHDVAVKIFLRFIMRCFLMSIRLECVIGGCWESAL